MPFQTKSPCPDAFKSVTTTAIVPASDEKFIPCVVLPASRHQIRVESTGPGTFEPPPVVQPGLQSAHHNFLILRLSQRLQRILLWVRSEEFLFFYTSLRTDSTLRSCSKILSSMTQAAWLESGCVFGRSWTRKHLLGGRCFQAAEFWINCDNVGVLTLLIGASAKRKIGIKKDGTLESDFVLLRKFFCRHSAFVWNRLLSTRVFQNCCDAVVANNAHSLHVVV